jgi:hypothetical protein
MNEADPQEKIADDSAPIPMSTEVLAERLTRLEQTLSQMQAAASGPPVPAHYVAPTPLPSTPEQRLRLWSLAAFRNVAAMHFDPRYRMSNLARYGVPLILLLLVCNYLLFTLVVTIPVFSPLCERLLIMTLSFGLFKILSRELSRYEAVLNYLAQYTRR